MLKTVLRRRTVRTLAKAARIIALRVVDVPPDRFLERDGAVVSGRRTHIGQINLGESQSNATRLFLVLTRQRTQSSLSNAGCFEPLAVDGRLDVALLKRVYGGYLTPRYVDGYGETFHALLGTWLDQL